MLLFVVVTCSPQSFLALSSSFSLPLLGRCCDVKRNSFPRAHVCSRQAGKQKGTEKTGLPSAQQLGQWREKKAVAEANARSREGTFTRFSTTHSKPRSHGTHSPPNAWQTRVTPWFSVITVFFWVRFLFSLHFNSFFSPSFFQKSFALICGSLFQLRKGCWYFIYLFIIIFNFVMLLKWHSTRSIFSQIWQYSKYESN